MIFATLPRQETPLDIPITTHGYKLAVVKATDAHTILEISPSQELQPGVSETKYIVLSHQELASLSSCLNRRYSETQDELYDAHVITKREADYKKERIENGEHPPTFLEFFKGWRNF